jgi:pimeloyl-ACP methyl ester carboxylesterase
MRPLEITIPLLLAAYYILLILRFRSRLLVIIPVLSLITLVIHLLIEGQRWQMIPLYALAIITFLTSLINFFNSKSISANHLSGWSKAGIIFTLMLVALSSLVPWLLPVPILMRPTGKYPVGTRTMTLTDTSRKEIYSGKDEPRKFMIELWYPAVSPDAGAKYAAWIPDAKIVAPAIADYINFPHFFLDHLTLVKSWSYENISISRSNGPYPVLIFSHGWNGFRQQSTFLMEELASHGYVVVALEHPYGARLTVFPDGSIAPNNPNALPKGKPAEEYEAAARILVDQWAGDIGYTINVLTELNREGSLGQFSNMFDLDKIGVLGHSTGGGATLQFCGTDSRCKAGLTLDAFVRPLGLSVINNGTRQPFFYMFSELWPFERNTELFQLYYSHVSPSNRIVTILGADHYDFSDLPALSPLAQQLGFKGPINGTRVRKIINTFVLAFFDQQFKNITSPYFDGPQAEFPDVRYGP